MTLKLNADLYYCASYEHKSKHISMGSSQLSVEGKARAKYWGYDNVLAAPVNGIIQSQFSWVQ
jgi:hypothetical protein